MYYAVTISAGKCNRIASDLIGLYKRQTRFNDVQSFGQTDGRTDGSHEQISRVSVQKRQKIENKNNYVPQRAWIIGE